nr:SMI1/KNR4 family protein [uncultured Flavobacterium sp.]
MEFSNQIERIKKKLILAQSIDKDLKVFGAKNHKYIIGNVISDEEILKFENDYNVSLPESYKAFLLHIGNGGISYENSAAGPSYGIFPFGENLNEFANDAKNYLNRECVIYPNMSKEFWIELTGNVEDDNISDEDFDEEFEKIFAGILPIGSQGCSYCYGLVLNGEFKGKVVNLDIEMGKPYFAFESNFLDWYERWLDEITAETSNDTDNLFNYTLGGAVSHILEIYSTSADHDIKMECLTGILKKKNLNEAILDVLEKEYQLSTGEIQKRLLQILTKFYYNRAFPHLIAFAKKDLLTVFQYVFWYAKNKSTDWLEVIKENISRINDDETFTFCTYLLKEMKFDYGAIIVPFSTHSSESIRVSTFYALGQLQNKKYYLDTFILGLNDNSNRVIHTTLQALEGINEKKLLQHYKHIAERFPEEQDYILINLNHRLKPFGLTNKKIMKIDPETFKIPK